MEMDYKLKKLANFFKFFLQCISDKSLKTDYHFFFLGQIGHFTVVCLVTWSWIVSEAGVTLF